MAIVLHPLMRTTTTKLYVYDPGTTDDKTVYTDSALSIAHSQPITSTATGVFAPIYGTGTVRMLYHDGDDVAIPSGDYDDVEITKTDANFDAWSSAVTYGVEDIRTYLTDHYISLQAANLNNIPSSAATYWSKMRLIRVFNTNETYSAADVVIGSDDALYASQAGSNVGNDPTTDTGANWRKTSENRWKEVAASYTAKAFEKVIPDNSAGVATLTLPASPVEGDIVDWRQKYGAPVGTFSVTIARNGNPIMADTEDILVDVEDFVGRMTYIDDATGWRVDYLGSTGA